MGSKLMFTVALMSGPLAILINTAFYTLEYNSSAKHSESNQNASSILGVNQTHNHSHDHGDELVNHHHIDNHHHHHSSLLEKVAQFALINIDPIMSIILSHIYVIFFFKVFKLAALILAQSVPPYIDVDKIKSDLKELVCWLLFLIYFY